MPTPQEELAIQQRIQKEEEDRLEKKRKEEEEEKKKKKVVIEEEEEPGEFTEADLAEAKKIISDLGIALDLDNFDPNNITATDANAFVDSLNADKIATHPFMQDKHVKGFAQGFVKGMLKWGEKNADTLKNGAYGELYSKGMDFLNKLSNKLGVEPDPEASKNNADLKNKFQQNLGENDNFTKDGATPKEASKTGSRLGAMAAKFATNMLDSFMTNNPEGLKAKAKSTFSTPFDMKPTPMNTGGGSGKS